MSEILEAYQQSLNELTFNSRPIIDNLTVIAKENPNVADGLLDLITQRIYKSIPEHKLYALYLLDSICKTTGNPYNILVGDQMFNLFSHVFQLVNDAIRNRLISLFETWKVTKTRGTNDPLFPKSQLNKIDEFLKKAGYPKAAGSGLSQQSLINEINHLMPVFENKIRSNPNPKFADRLKALNQLKLILSTQVMKINELQAIQNQLQAIREQEQTSSSSRGGTPSGTPSATPAPASLPPTPKANPVFQIFQDLILSGLVKKDQEPIPGSKPVYSLVFPQTKYVPSSNEFNLSGSLEDFLLASSSIQRSEYEKLKFTEMTKVNKSAFSNLQDFIKNNKPNTKLRDLLYDAKASKCSICGKRFTTDQEGSTKKRLHLDWHFRINKKLSTKGSNVQSRNWYVDDYEWVHFNEDELLEYSTDVKLPDIGQDDKAAANLITSSYVVVPSTETNMNNKCLICREQVKARYNDEIGEWVWEGCIRQPGEGKNSRKIVHIACFNESSKKRSADEDLNVHVKRERV
ncbi:Protein PCF11 [Candida viswanathii]|uniref:Protein PCF11 n=1 Tax=Candida viswanathii TaxID=5486 RepID=A0A367XWU9_9ASCO|nr:Protein PCF11 [Candida viswanathii]